MPSNSYFGSNMERLLGLALVCLVESVVAEEESVAPIELDYHNAIGIPAAARIKAAEEALDFHDARIVGGEAASLGQYPYFGGVLISLNTGKTSVCGCSLLTHTRAVFAAHCVTSRGTHGVEYTAVFGSTRLYSGGTRRTTKQSQKHSLYDDYTLANDIALLYFVWVPYTDNIHNISLACGTDQFVGTWAWTAGFGLTSDDDTSIINSKQFLSHVQVQVITNAKCSAFFGSESIKASNICVSTDGGHGTCGGDSGGPLVANSQLIGIISFGSSKGCELGYPKALTRVTAFASWIKNRL